MPVIAHAQHQHINCRQFSQQAIGLFGSTVQVHRSTVEAQEPGLGRRALQQVFFNRPALLSACSTGTQRSSARVIVTLDQSRPCLARFWKTPPGCGHRTPPASPRPGH